MIGLFYVIVFVSSVGKDHPCITALAARLVSPEMINDKFGKWTVK